MKKNETIAYPQGIKAIENDFRRGYRILVVKLRKMIANKKSFKKHDEIVSGAQ